MSDDTRKDTPPKDTPRQDTPPKATPPKATLGKGTLGKEKEETPVTGPNKTVLTVARVRGTVARVLWIVCLVLALVLACAAFSYALEANRDNDLVKGIRDLADAVDLRYFDLQKPVKEFDNPNGTVKTALFNYGIAAVLYLIAGRFLERIVRP